jgi:hypothetical protein
MSGARTISERDWKIFRPLHTVALERYCERILEETKVLVGDERASAHDRFLELCDLLRGRNEALADMFDELKRSTAFFQLARMRGEGLVTDEEMSRFSDETRGVIAVLAGEGATGEDDEVE